LLLRDAPPTVPESERRRNRRVHWSSQVRWPHTQFRAAASGPATAFRNASRNSVAVSRS